MFIVLHTCFYYFPSLFFSGIWRIRLVYWAKLYAGSRFEIRMGVRVGPCTCSSLSWFADSLRLIVKSLLDCHRRVPLHVYIVFELGGHRHRHLRKWVLLERRQSIRVRGWKRWGSLCLKRITWTHLWFLVKTNVCYPLEIVNCKLKCGGMRRFERVPCWLWCTTVVHLRFQWFRWSVDNTHPAFASGLKPFAFQ